jgi:hypothetical protein
MRATDSSPDQKRRAHYEMSRILSWGVFDQLLVLIIETDNHQPEKGPMRMSICVYQTIVAESDTLYKRGNHTNHGNSVVWIDRGE